MRRDLYYVYRLGCDRVITDANIYAKTLCTAFEIREYLDFLNATDKFGHTYVARKSMLKVSDNMTIGISMLQLLKEFAELPFGIYTVEIKKGENKTFWYVAYTDYDGITITASEFVDAEDDFDYEIYNQTFMEEAFRFYNHELESQL